MLVAFQVEDWNRDFSPWEALAVFGTEAFAGQGKRTLKWLVEEGVPYIDIFSGIECCSGSLWFKDWEIYMREHTLKRKCSVYLSLGGKEEKLLLEDPCAKRVVLEWNPGGHFADSGKRLAKGIKWLTEKRYELKNYGK